MIKVYFETNTHAEVIATFDSEEEYIEALPKLEKWAAENHGFITESMEG